MMKLENRLLRDIMTRGVVTVSVTAKVKEIVSLLSRQGLSGVAVIGNDGVAVGVISDMDILKVIGIENWGNITAESIMTSTIQMIKPMCTLGEAAKMMREKSIHRLLVFSESGVGASQRPIGILSTSDIVREAAREETI
ncbi:MAG: CBS domain-containing protein [Methanosarcinales archaeon]|nr:MAG: CBS domain-containing protein [Methanosarcinales archaeon]